MLTCSLTQSQTQTRHTPPNAQVTQSKQVREQERKFSWSQHLQNKKLYLHKISCWIQKNAEALFAQNKLFDTKKDAKALFATNKLLDTKKMQHIYGNSAHHIKNTPPTLYAHQKHHINLLCTSHKKTCHQLFIKMIQQKQHNWKILLVLQQRVDSTHIPSAPYQDNRLIAQIFLQHPTKTTAW